MLLQGFVFLARGLELSIQIEVLGQLILKQFHLDARSLTLGFSIIALFGVIFLYGLALSLWLFLLQFATINSLKIRSFLGLDAPRISPHAREVLGGPVEV